MKTKRITVIVSEEVNRNADEALAIWLVAVELCVLECLAVDLH
jgi:hypothetical protein